MENSNDQSEEKVYLRLNMLESEETLLHEFNNRLLGISGPLLCLTLHCRRWSINQINQRDELFKAITDFPSLHEIIIEYGDIRSTGHILNSIQQGTSIQSLQLVNCQFSGHDFADFLSNADSFTTLHLDDVIIIDGWLELQTAVEQHSTITTWDLDGFADGTDYILRGLAGNQYVRILYLGQEVPLGESIVAELIEGTRTLQKLSFNSMSMNVFSFVSIVWALIRCGESITDLEFKYINFIDDISCQILLRLFEKRNFEKLALHWIRGFDNISFHASVFSNMMLKTLNELDIDFRLIAVKSFMNDTEVIKLFHMFKDSILKKLTIRGHVNQNNDIFLILLKDVIPDMKFLSYFTLLIRHRTVLPDLRHEYINAISKSRLIEVAKLHHVHDSRPLLTYHQQSIVNKYLKRNMALIQLLNGNEKKSFKYNSRGKWPKVFVSIKETGPDAIFRLLSKLGMEVG